MKVTEEGLDRAIDLFNDAHEAVTEAKAVAGVLRTAWLHRIDLNGLVTDLEKIVDRLMEAKADLDLVEEETDES